MAYSFGGGINPQLGAIDYSPILRGAQQYAQSTAAGSAAIGQGIGNALASIGQGVQGYYQKKEQKQMEEQAAATFQTMAKENPEFARYLGIQDLEDKALVKSVIKSLGGPAQAIAAAKQIEKFKTDQQSAAVANFLSQGQGQMPSMIDRRKFSPQALQQGESAYLQNALLKSEINKNMREKQVAQPVIMTPSEVKSLRDQGMDFDATPLSNGNFAVTKVSAFAPQAQTNVNVAPGEGAYSKTIGEETAKADTAAYDAASKAVKSIPRIQQTIKLVDEGKATTGVLSGVITDLNRIRTKFLKDIEAGKAVEDTQVLNALLGSRVFEQIQSLGIGARGLDTPAEREFLREVMTGTTQLEPGTIKRLAELSLAKESQAIQSFNERVSAGELDRFFEGTKRTKKLFDVPQIQAPSVGRTRRYNPTTGKLE